MNDIPYTGLCTKERLLAALMAIRGRLLKDVASNGSARLLTYESAYITYFICDVVLCKCNTYDRWYVCNKTGGMYVLRYVGKYFRKGWLE